MPMPRKYANAQERSREGSRRRRLREGLSAKPQPPKPAPVVPLTTSQAIAIYRTERALAEQRWATQGGPSCGFTSGRHPILRDF